MARLLKILFFPAVFGVLLYLSYQKSPQEVAFDTLWEEANEGNVAAQYKLAMVYHEGTMAPFIGLNEEKAVEWFTKASEQGHVLSQMKLAEAFYYGQSVPEDYEQAFEWMMKAAEQGNPDAQYNLGMMYNYGKGVPQD